MAAPATDSLPQDSDEPAPAEGSKSPPSGRPPGMRSCPGCGNDAIFVSASTLARSGPVVGETDGYKVHRGDDGSAYYHPKRGANR